MDVGDEVVVEMVGWMSIEGNGSVADNCAASRPSAVGMVDRVAMSQIGRCDSMSI